MSSSGGRADALIGRPDTCKIRRPKAAVSKYRLIPDLDGPPDSASASLCDKPDLRLPFDSV